MKVNEIIRLLAIKEYGSQNGLSKAAGAPPSSLTLFFKENKDIGHKRFLKILEVLNFDLEANLKLLLTGDKNTTHSIDKLGTDLEYVFSQLDRLPRKSVIDSLQRELKLQFANGMDLKLEQSLQRITKGYL